MSDRILTLRVARRIAQTPEISAFELVHPRGLPLPCYEAGAHVDVHLPGGFTRQYSIAQAPTETPPLAYRIAVKREPKSRGGSAAMHTRVHEGDLLPVSAPRNTFPLVPHARKHLLLAGGIGLTPLLAMAQTLASRQQDFELYCFARSREHLAFADDLSASLLRGRVHLHFDQPQTGARVDLREVFSQAQAGVHVYICGPTGFMRAVRDAASGWPDEQIHVEYFAAPTTVSYAHDAPFELILVRRGITLTVDASQTAVAALHDLGIDVPTSCEQGLCGTCVVPLLQGEADHRDYCLSSGERNKRIALCCSRARGQRLVVDL